MIRLRTAHAGALGVGLPLALFVLVAVVGGCGGGGAGGGGGGGGLLAGAREYTGTYPDPATVRYTDSGQPVEVKAFPGQVLVFFATAIDEAQARGLIEASGGTIVEEFPATGYYMADVGPGEEEAFISTTAADGRVYQVLPNVAGSLSSPITILDGCNVQHAASVEQVIRRANARFARCRKINIGSTDDVAPNLIVTNAYWTIQQSADPTILINLSAAGGLNGVDYTGEPAAVRAEARAGWTRFVRATLAAIASLPDRYREGLVLTVAAGNGNMPLGTLLAQIRTDPKMSSILDDHVLIVGSRNTHYPLSNHAARDSAFVTVHNEEARAGTSFAAPYAMAIIERVLTARSHLTAVQAVQAAKAAQSSDGELTLSGVLAQADRLFPRPGPPPGNLGGTWRGTYTFSTTTTFGCTPTHAGALTVKMTQNGSVLRATCTFQGVQAMDSNCIPHPMTLEEFCRGSVSDSTITLRPDSGLQTGYPLATLNGILTDSRIDGEIAGHLFLHENPGTGSFSVTKR